MVTSLNKVHWTQMILWVASCNNSAFGSQLNTFRILGFLWSTEFMNTEYGYTARDFFYWKCIMFKLSPFHKRCQYQYAAVDCGLWTNTLSNSGIQCRRTKEVHAVNGCNTMGHQTVKCPRPLPTNLVQYALLGHYQDCQLSSNITNVLLTDAKLKLMQSRNLG